MSSPNLADELRNDVIEEQLCYVADIKDMISKFGPVLHELIARNEAMARRGDFAPDEAVAVRRSCAVLREQFANALKETLRFEAAVRLAAPRAGYPYLLNEKGTA